MIERADQSPARRCQICRKLIEGSQPRVDVEKYACDECVADLDFYDDDWREFTWSTFQPGAE